MRIGSGARAQVHATGEQGQYVGAVPGSVAQRLVLRDVHGERVQLDPRVLTSNPLIWHLLEQGAHRSYENGTLLCGMTALERLGERIDGEACRAILRASGLS